MKYLAKLSSELGARDAGTAEESENTSTNKLPLDAGGGTEFVTGAAPRPKRSAEGDGVDYKRRYSNFTQLNMAKNKPHNSNYATPPAPNTFPIQTETTVWLIP